MKKLTERCADSMADVCERERQREGGEFEGTKCAQEEVRIERSKRCAGPH